MLLTVPKGYSYDLFLPLPPKQKETQVRFLGKCSLEGSRTLRKLREGVRRNLATAHAAERQEDWAITQ